MPHTYSLKIAGKSSFERGIYQAAVFKNHIKLEFYKDGEIIKTASLSAGQTALSNTLQSARDKIRLFCERLGIEETQLEYERSELPKIEKTAYKLLSFTKKLFDAFIPVQWVIVFRHKDDSTWKKIIPDSRVFQADPFIIFKNNTYYIFYEELQFKDWHGYLMVAELDPENAKLINPKIILKKEYHLSYPCIFEENGRFYMIPESADAGSVDLYECTSFPYQWQKNKTLLDIQAVDSTPLKTSDGWYLFTTEISKGAGCNDELSIYKSPELLTKPFKKLYDEPVVSDVTNARMGGHFIKEGDAIYRVAQNCGKRYGHKLHINKLIQIEGGYREKTIEILQPDFPALSFHTYNQDKDIIVGDMEIPRFDFYSLKRFTWVQFKRVFTGITSLVANKRAS